MMNIETNPILNSIGVVSCKRPCHSVPIQLNTLIPLGSAISMVEIMNDMAMVKFIPDTNMWCPHTIKPSDAIAILVHTIE